MKNKKLIILLFVLVLLPRLFFEFSTPEFSDGKSYFHLRQIENIKETGLPLFKDGLGYSGREIIFSPLFAYLLVPFSFFGNYAIKLFLSVLIALTAIITFYFAKLFSDEDRIAFIAALLFSFSPLLFASTLNRITVLSVMLPLTISLIYLSLRIKKEEEIKKKINLYVLLSFLIALLSPISLLVAMVLIFYIFLLLAESFKIERSKIEALLFSVFLIIFSNLLIYKKVFISTGLKTVAQNMPSELLGTVFSASNVFAVITSIGLITLVFGSIGLIILLFSKPSEHALISLAFIVSLLSLFFLKWIDLNTGLLMMLVPLTLFAAKGIDTVRGYYKKTKLTGYRNLFFIIIILLFLVSNVYLSYSDGRKVIQKSLSQKELNALVWLKERTPNNIVVLSTAGEGHLITFFADRKAVWDDYFMLAPDVEEISKNVYTIFTTNSETEALDLLKYYNVRYIYLSERAKEKYLIENLRYANDPKCFRQSYEQGPEIIKVTC